MVAASARHGVRLEPDTAWTESAVVTPLDNASHHALKEWYSGRLDGSMISECAKKRCEITTKSFPEFLRGNEQLAAWLSDVEAGEVALTQDKNKVEAMTVDGHVQFFDAQYEEVTADDTVLEATVDKQMFQMQRVSAIVPLERQKLFSENHEWYGQ